MTKILYQQTFDDKDFERLEKAKKQSKLTWKEFILKKCLENNQRSEI